MNTKTVGWREAVGETMGATMSNRKGRPKIVGTPRPLLTSPSRHLWDKYAGEDYKVFVDESFFEFFGLVAKEGFFCFGAVGVPAAQYEAFARFLEPVRDRFRQLTGVAEIKHAELRRFDYRDQRDIACRVRDALMQHGGLIAGFFTPVRASVLEWVRMALLGEADEIPEDHDHLYAAEVVKLGELYRGPGRSATIGRLLMGPVASLANFFASQESHFEMTYDPREKGEDRAVKANVESYVGVLQGLKNLPPGEDRADVADFFTGFRSDRRSDQEIGLQVADFVAGEVRRFMQANEELLRYGASRRLITPTSREAVMTATRLGEAVFKTGVLHRMPPDLRARFQRPDPEKRTVFHLLAQLLASGILTCYSTWGTPRHLMPFEGLIIDQLD